MYALARWVWNIARWVWLTLVVPVVVDLFKSALSAKKPADIIPNSFLFGSNYRILTLSVLGVLFVITLVARIVVAIEDRGKGGKALREYLRGERSLYAPLRWTGRGGQR